MNDPQPSHDEGPAAELRHLPVPREAGRLPVRRVVSGRVVRSERGGVVAVATAAGGFLAGVVTLGLLQALRQRSPSPRRRPRRVRGAEVTGTRSFLIDVHVLRR